MDDDQQPKGRALFAALAAFQADLPKVTKGSVNPHFKSRYADLADITNVVVPLLAKHGLAWVTMPKIIDGSFVLVYELVHEDGDHIGGVYPIGDGKPQEIGSALTYARRYTLCAVTGVAPDGDDDDGNAAQEASTKDWGQVLALAATIDTLDELRALYVSAGVSHATDAVKSAFIERVEHVKANPTGEETDGAEYGQ
jgi:hypothetical protein